jgi:Glycosyl hydrolase family 115/Gylcosyl hydrolase family 115 C-terminal domain
MNRFRIPLIIALSFSLAAASIALAIESNSYVSADAGAGRFALAAASKPAPLVVSTDDWPGVVRAAKNLQADIHAVTGAEPQFSTGEVPAGTSVVLIGTLGKSPLIDKLVADKKLDAADLAGKWETFVLQVVDKPLPGVDSALVIAGSDKRGTIFGIYDLSTQIGVSPWSWWADVPVRSQHELYVLPGRHTRGTPAVKYRGIFINDEAPELTGWVKQNFKGFNHEFYEHVFELILRLKGNYLWPAMWQPQAFSDDDPENPRLADEMGVVIGTSHHEPLMRAHDEWTRYGKGAAWNYEQNEEMLKQFWAGGVKRMGNYESIVTVGMRGDGDKPMSEGSNIALLEKIVADQRKIIADETGRDPATVTQDWALYKEVQDYYDKGMTVPDDITLLLCDDNWGNVRKLPKLGDKPRQGGYGMYYHFDYVGGPRNYKWLNSTQIARTWEQMHLCHDYGVNQIWIVNVGDIKPLELPISFFLDYAWSPESWPLEKLPRYTKEWAAQQFGAEHAAAIADILTKYTSYNARRKPEMLSPTTYSLANYGEAERVVGQYSRLADEAEKLGQSLPSEYRDAYFQLVLFPVEACANLNAMYLAAARNQLYAKQGRAATADEGAMVQTLFDKDAELSRQFNKDLAGGKWNHFADQTHIGYTNWQQPSKNIMPKVEEIELPAAAEMGVAIEGTDKWWPNEKGEAELPEFDYHQAQSHSIDVFNRGQEPFDYKATCPESWVLISPESKEGRVWHVEKQQRLWVTIAWPQVPAGLHRVPITIRGPGGNEVVIQAVVNNPAAPTRDEIIGFVEGNGGVSMEAAHFTRAVDAPPIKWQVIPDFGRTLSGVTMFPTTAESQTPGGKSPHLEYDLRLYSGGPVRVQAYLSPTLNFTRSDGLKYAVSFDDEEPQIVNIHTGTESVPGWEKMVGDSINIRTTKHELSQPGEHVLKFWMIDPGVVLQKIVVSHGDVPASYLGPPESFYRVTK